MKKTKKTVILYIDSDPVYQEKAKEAFSGAGYECILCGTLNEGLERMTEKRPDVVIVEYELPDGSGEEMYTHVLTHSRFREYRDIPFIILIQNGKVERSHLYSLGFNACLAKPFGVNALMEFVDDVIVSHQLKMEEIYCWETIREAKDFLERVVESSVDAIVTTNTRGVITYCNRAAEEMFGYPFEQLVGKRVGMLLAKGNSELLKISAVLRKRRQLQNYKTLALRQNGEKFPVNFSISIMCDSDGRPMGTLSICKEISMNKFSEYEKGESRRISAVLETAVAVNHAINNPLVPILGNAQFLLQDERIVDEDIRRRLRIIVKNALRIREITQKLANIHYPVSKEYLKGTRMLDIDASA